MCTFLYVHDCLAARYTKCAPDHTIDEHKLIPSPATYCMYYTCCNSVESLRLLNLANQLNYYVYSKHVGLIKSSGMHYVTHSLLQEIEIHPAN